MEVWIDLTCTKCSSALFLLEQAGQDYAVRRLLNDPPSVGELQDLVRRLAVEPWDLARMDEPVSRRIGLASWERSAATREQWIEAMARHPVLIERPVIIADDGTAVLAQTREAVRSVLSSSSFLSMSSS